MRPRSVLLSEHRDEGAGSRAELDVVEKPEAPVVLDDGLNGTGPSSRGRTGRTGPEAAGAGHDRQSRATPS